ncbi:MAG: hypothetical protein ABI693_06985 [Bryobacteraceae bacterium]
MKLSIMASVVRSFFTHVVPAVIKPMRVVWNQSLGLLFLLIALLVTAKLRVAWTNFSGQFGELVMLVFSTAFAVLMAGYALWSFLRARKISRS